MTKITDETLNKLIDNELNSSEIDELYNLIKNNEELLSKTKAMQIVDNVLKTLDTDVAPGRTTELIMEKVSASVLKRDRKNGFIKGVLGFFGFSILFSIVYFLFSKPRNSKYVNSIYSEIMKNISEYLPKFKLSFSNDLTMVLLAIFVLIFLISISFLYHEHKSFKLMLSKINSDI